MLLPRFKEVITPPLLFSLFVQTILEKTTSALSARAMKTVYGQLVTNKNPQHLSVITTFQYITTNSVSMAPIIHR